jgi:DNA-directed RNA polymerase specialized sigma subunit
MKMKIKAKWVVSCQEGFATFDLSDVNCETEQEWNELSESEKEERLQQAIDELPERPYMILEKYKVH